MTKSEFKVLKSSGEKADFSLTKLRQSLLRSGADELTIDNILNVVRDELYQGISTKEIYNRAFALLKQSKPVFASKYKLKKAIMELGPTGYPFENFVGSVLSSNGYQVNLREILQGKCVSHEIDVIAKKKDTHILVECKFRNDKNTNCSVKVPLYIHSRYQDILAEKKGSDSCPTECWVVTNTRFTSDAIKYSNCVGLYLLSWDYPKGNSLKDRIDKLGLYPITVSTLITNKEKQFLLSRDVVLCRQLLNDHFYLDHLGISENRKAKILAEISTLSKIQ